MRFATAISTAANLETACLEAAERARRDLGAGRIDLCIVFVAAGYPACEQVPQILGDALAPATLFGCTGGGILGGGDEVEGQLAVSITLARLPRVQIHAALVTDADLPDPDAPPSAWVERIGIAADSARGFVVIPEPFTFSAERLLGGLDYAYPGVPKIGGIASGSRHPGGHALFLDRSTHHGGALVVSFAGDVVIEPLVAQGCKPFGKVGRITEAEHNYLKRVDGQPAMGFLQEQLETLQGEELELARSTPVFLGIAMDPFTTRAPEPGDFLIRNLLGFDPRSGTLSVGELLSVGRAVQFHLRDASTSREDLRQVLERATRTGAPAARGALLFSCLGRGHHLYGERGHDSRLFRDLVGAVPLGGFFCNGEIGPVQGTTYLHGYTSSFALFRERPRA